MASTNETKNTVLRLQSVASKMYAKAKAEEPSVTETLQALNDELGGEFQGLDYRLKDETSLERKIMVSWSEMQERGDRCTLDQAAQISVTDALRYTIVFPTESYTQAVNKVHAELLTKGFTTCEFRNYWGPDQAYRGINAVYYTITGTTPRTEATPRGFNLVKIKWELQMHTPESFETKQYKTHPYYEAFRIETNSHKKYQIYLEMCMLFDEVPAPPGVLELPMGVLRKKDMVHPDDMEKAARKRVIEEARENFERGRLMEQCIDRFCSALRADALDEQVIFTRDMEDLVATIPKARLEKLHRRVKTKQSLRRKLLSEVQAQGGKVSLVDSVNKIIDALRYMVVIEGDVYTSAVEMFLEKMQQKYVVQHPIRNYWPGADRDSAIKVVFLSKERLLKVEVQLHTPDSFWLKLARYQFVRWANQGLMEAGLDRTAQDKFLTHMYSNQETMRSFVARVPVPEGVETIGEVQDKGKDYANFVYCSSGSFSAPMVTVDEFGVNRTKSSSPGEGPGLSPAKPGNGRMSRTSSAPAEAVLMTHSALEIVDVPPRDSPESDRRKPSPETSLALFACGLAVGVLVATAIRQN